MESFVLSVTAHLTLLMLQKRDVDKTQTAMLYMTYFVIIRGISVLAQSILLVCKRIRMESIVFLQKNE